MTDVDAINDRLNGLVTLLQAVGVGGEEVDRVSKNFGKGGRQLNDDQVEALIRKLQLAQSEAPQIIAALEAQAEARSLSGGGGGSRGGGSASGRQPQPQQHEEEEDDDDDDDDDDEYDENANYPMVGYGCSDDCSVVSDLTTPTVVEGSHIAEEEHYRDTLPPMIIGGGPGAAPAMLINPTKRKNLVNQVARPQHGSSGGQTGIAPPPRRNTPAVSRAGGAAASRRKNYQETMAKLHENPHAMGYAGPSGVPTAASSAALRKAPARNKSTAAGAGAVKKRQPRGPTAADVGNFSELASSRTSTTAATSWEAPSTSNGWNAFDNSTPAPKMGRRSSATGALARTKTRDVDSDGFLAGSGGFDAFNSGGGFNSSPADSDLAFDAGHASFASAQSFDAFGNASSNSVRKTRPKRPEAGQRPSPVSASAGSAAVRPKGPASQGRPRRARRASLAM